MQLTEPYSQFWISFLARFIKWPSPRLQLLSYKNGDCSNKEFEKSFKYSFMYVKAFLSPVKLDILT